MLVVHNDAILYIAHAHCLLNYMYSLRACGWFKYAYPVCTMLTLAVLQASSWLALLFVSSWLNAVHQVLIRLNAVH